MEINNGFFNDIQDSFKRYVEYKQEIDTNIVDNNEWLKQQMEFSKHGDINSTTAFVFNAIANKHADAMDNFPEPNILPRHQRDEQEAGALTKILPVQLEMSDFKKVYSHAWWSKLKHGAAIYGVFFDPISNNGMGDIKIRQMDILNVFWEPYINDIQESQYLFVTSFIRTKQLKEIYTDKQITSFSDEVSIQHYSRHWNEDIYREKSLVIDCYYKTGNQVHLLKFCGDTILSSTEQKGMDTLYEHGMYPIVIDSLFYNEESPIGIGLIQLMKNPQEYINKLDSVISKNALISGKVRFMVKDNGGINEHELTDMSSDIIHVAGSVDETNIRQLQAMPLDAYIINHRQNKIAEMKEVAGNRDFQQGGTSNGVTAYSAIAALQQTGEKLSRDMINESYETYKNIIYMCIEIIRQFYFEPRSYRCVNSVGQSEYVTYTNKGILNGESDDGYYRRPEFDVEVCVQKNNPYSKVTQNQLAQELYKLGVFNKDNVHQSIMLVELLQFEGKEKVIEFLQTMDKGEMINEESK